MSFEIMTTKFAIVLVGVIMGFFVTYVVIYSPYFSTNSLKNPLAYSKKQVIGFLPYWLLEKAKKDYSQEITTLTYFGLTIDTNGKILTHVNEQETELGWHALQSGKLDSLFSDAKKNNIALSLLIFNGDPDAINTLVQDPLRRAQNLVNDVAPIMRQYGFTDLNLDIENVQEASKEARMHFTQFVKEVKKGLNEKRLGTLTAEIMGTDLIRSNITNVVDVAAIADNIVLMAYDYHYAGSFVTGPVAPLFGAGKMLEYDTQTAVEKALAVLPSQKLLLGVPLYGYEWETINNNPHAAVIPGTGIVASNRRVEKLLVDCAACSAQMDMLAQESWLTYKDQDSGTYHYIAYPNQESTKAKIDFAIKQKLGGIALWALGYEGSTILDPLKQYIR